MCRQVPTHPPGERTTPPWKQIPQMIPEPADILGNPDLELPVEPLLKSDPRRPQRVNDHRGFEPPLRLG